MLPHVMAFNLIGNPTKFAQIAGAMGEEVRDYPVWRPILWPLKRLRSSSASSKSPFV